MREHRFIKNELWQSCYIRALRIPRIRPTAGTSIRRGHRTCATCRGRCANLPCTTPTLSVRRGGSALRSRGQCGRTHCFISTISGVSCNYPRCKTQTGSEESRYVANPPGRREKLGRANGNALDRLTFRSGGRVPFMHAGGAFTLTPPSVSSPSMHWIKRRSRWIQGCCAWPHGTCYASALVDSVRMTIGIA